MAVSILSLSLMLIGSTRAAIITAPQGLITEPACFLDKQSKHSVGSLQASPPETQSVSSLHGFQICTPTTPSSLLPLVTGMIGVDRTSVSSGPNVQTGR